VPICITIAYGVWAWRGRIKCWLSPLTCFVALTTLSHYRASVQVYDIRRSCSEGQWRIYTTVPWCAADLVASGCRAWGLWRVLSLISSKTHRDSTRNNRLPGTGDTHIYFIRPVAQTVQIWIHDLGKNAAIALDEPKQRTLDVWHGLSVINDVVNESHKCFHACVLARRGHFKHLCWLASTCLLTFSLLILRTLKVNLIVFTLFLQRDAYA